MTTTKTSLRISHLLSFAVLLIVMLLCFSVNAVATDEGKFDYSLFLNRMGISTVWDENNYITRGDFVSLAVQALDINASTSESFFSDVSGTQGEYINIAAQLGIVSLSNDGKFYPDRIIVTEEAAAICMRVLGYGDILKKESYPEGYLKFASKIDILENVSIGSKLTGADATKIIFNTLDSKYIEPNYYNAENITYSMSSYTYGQERFGLFKGNGIVQSVCGLSLGGISAEQKNKIIINGATYENPYYSDFNNYTYLGREVTFYVLKKADFTEVIYISTSEEQLRLDSADIENVVGFDASDSTANKKKPYLTYIDRRDNKSNTISIASDATFLVNGIVTNNITNGRMRPDFGTLYLTDRNNDNVYDVVLIESYRYYKIEYYNAADACLNDFYGNEAIRIDEFKRDDVFVVSGDKVMDADAIPSKGILQIMCTYDAAGNIDYDGFIRISVMTNRVKGKIDSSDDEYVYIEGTAYKALDTIMPVLKERLGYTTTFTIGDNNVIVDYDAFADSIALQYGYLIGIDSDIFEKKFKFYLLTEDDEVCEFNSSAEMKYTGMYNGKYCVGRKLKNKEIETVIAPYQAVKYMLDADKNIELIETAYDNSAVEEYKGYDENRFTLDYQDNCKLYSTWIGSDYTATGSTIYFYVKPGSTSVSDFRTGTYMSYGLNHENNLDVKVYDAGPGLSAKIVVVENLATEGKITDTFIQSGTTTVIKDMRRGTKKDGTDSAFCRVIVDGLQQFFPVDENLAPSNELFLGVSTNVTKFSELEAGDVISYFLNKNGEIYRYIVLHEYDETQSDSNMIYENIGNLDGVEHSGAFRRVSGRVDRFYPGSHLVLDAFNSQNLKIDLSVSGAKYFEFDTRNKTLKTMKVVPTLNKNDYVWVYLYRRTTKIIVRYV